MQVDRNVVFLTSMVILSVLGRKYLKFELDETIAHRPVFQMLVVFAIVYINTKSFVASIASGLLIHLLMKTNVLVNESFVSGDNNAQRPRGPKRPCPYCGKN